MPASNVQQQKFETVYFGKYQSLEKCLVESQLFYIPLQISNTCYVNILSRCTPKKLKKSHQYIVLGAIYLHFQRPTFYLDNQIRRLEIHAYVAQILQMCSIKNMKLGIHLGTLQNSNLLKKMLSGKPIRYATYHFKYQIQILCQFFVRDVLRKSQNRIRSLINDHDL